MSYINCESCGFMYEVKNYQPCPTCAMFAEQLEADEEEEPEYFYDGEYTFELKEVA